MMVWALVLGLCAAGCLAQGDYYKNIDPTAKDSAMLDQLFALLNPHTAITYDQVWAAFREIDNKNPACSDPDQIKGPYSMYCWNATEQCGNYKKEGDCYNREHSWPKSWWGGFDVGKNAQTDLHHIFPTDGYVNAERSNYPYGWVSKPTYVSTNGGKLGPCDNSAPYTGVCFEPADEAKGELARGYLYLSTTYRNVWGCCSEDGVDFWGIQPWMETVVRSWHEKFPPTAQEMRRNDLIFEMFQKNRNPFIDHPEWAGQISSFAKDIKATL